MIININHNSVEKNKEFQKIVKSYYTCPILYELSLNWEYILPEHLSKFLSPSKTVFQKRIYMNGTLILNTNGYLAMEIKRDEENILKCINAYFGDNKVFNTIIVRVK